MKCTLDEGRLDPIRSCMTHFLDPDPAGSEWANTSVSAAAVAYSCGAIRRRGEAIDHEHDPDEWRLCRRLADEAARVMAGVEVGMGSSLESYFAPFYVVADERLQGPRVLDEAAVRAAFGGCLYPGLRIVVEPLREHGEWWTLVRESLVDNDDALEDDELMEEGRAELARWKELLRWFRGRQGIRSASAVLIEAGGRSSKGWTCCNFPCLIIGLTAAGSLVGIWGARVDR